MLSPYSSVVEKLHRDVNKERVTMLKVERAGDVLVDAVSRKNGFIFFLKIELKIIKLSIFNLNSRQKWLNQFYCSAKDKDY